MENSVSLTANTELTSGGHKYGAGMQFTCDEAAADALVKSGQASRTSAAPEQRAAVKGDRPKSDPFLTGAPTEPKT